MESENGDMKPKMEDYEVVEQIGRGSLADTFIVLHKIEKKKYVLKKFCLPAKQTEKLKHAAHQEIMKLIAKLNNPYIVEHKDAWLDKGDCICIVTGYCEGGNIVEIMKKASRKLFSEEKLCKWFTHLLLAVDYLHSNRIIHRDLKCSNIFLTEDNDIRLGTCGLVKLLNTEDSECSATGNPNYRCPEVLAGVPYGYKSDIWSLGCCMFEIAAHEPPFRASDTAGLIYKINRSFISPLPIVYSSTLKQIIKSMLRKTPEHRPTAAELLRQPHLQRYVLQCHNPSSVFLPIFPITNSKDKTPRKSPSSKFSSPKESRSRKSGSPNLVENIADFVETADLKPRNLMYNEKAASSSSAEDKLEIKMVDPTSFAVEISGENSIHGSKDVQTNCETSPCHRDRETNSFTEPEDEGADIEILSRNRPNSQHEELATESFQQLDEVNIKTVNLEDPKIFCDQQVFEKPEIDAESANDLLPMNDLDGTKTDNISPSLQTKKDDFHANNEARSDTSILSMPTKIEAEASKNEGNSPSLQRGEALESLLELSARLLKEDKLEELAGLLRPFGEEGVSPRETAIWLTKTLMSANKLNQGS